MPYAEMLQTTLEYIDAHIQDEITLEDLAAMNGFSPTHFSHVFRYGTGYAVMQYLRLRRLLFAASELKSGRRIIDIAMDYGFETHSGFTKAFKRHFRCAPEAYARHATLKAPRLPDLNHMKKYTSGGIIMEPRFIGLPETQIAGYILRTTCVGNENTRAIPAFWVDYMSNGRMEKLHQESFLKAHAEYGACFPEDSQTGEFQYMIGVALKEDAQAPEGYAVRTIPAASYAVFSSPAASRPEFTMKIQGTWDYIMNEWFPSSGYEYAAGCMDYELYDERCMGDKDLVCDIYIPVVKVK